MDRGVITSSGVVSGGSGTGFSGVVANYSALPDASLSNGKFYWVQNSQGTKWLPSTLGGTYYPNGTYYSNGTTWEYVEVPYQATQSEVNAGTVTDKFVTPSTLMGTLKTINGNVLMGGSGNIQVGDVLLGGNTVTSTMLIGTNSNHAVQIETFGVVRQTIANDGLVTFNGTSGNAGVVRMRQLQILDFDGVTWRDAIRASTTTTGVIEILSGTGSSGGLQFPNGFTTSGTAVIGAIVGNANFLSVGTQTHQVTIRCADYAFPTTLGLTIISGNQTASVANGNSATLYLATGNVTNAGALSSQSSSSVRIDSGTVAGAAKRGGLAIFNDNAEPTWNGLQRGIFIGNARAEPTDNPTGGGFLWVFNGALKYRGSSGTATTIALA